jgi:hypothetical protein
MNKTINQEFFTTQLFDMLTETFEMHHGIYLDKGTSLFDTLETVTAEEASQLVGGKCAALSAQVAHVTFFLEVAERYIQGRPDEDVDWGKIWRTIEKVSSADWESLRENLRQTYYRVLGELHRLDSWNDEKSIEGAMAMVVHSAYHLGEIRQAFCTLR